tara:strand:- start:143 stop:250 length:108 start_codon:yes stop_codon:yes gene_type:complete
MALFVTERTHRMPLVAQHKTITVHRPLDGAALLIR